MFTCVHMYVRVHVVVTQSSRTGHPLQAGPPLLPPERFLKMQLGPKEGEFLPEQVLAELG